MMSEKPKRTWFRFHLITAILLMAEIGTLIGLNVAPRPGGIRGWPENCVWWLAGRSLPYDFCERRFVIDAGIAFLIVATTAKISESILHRREARKP